MSINILQPESQVELIIDPDQHKDKNNYYYSFKTRG